MSTFRQCSFLLLLVGVSIFVSGCGRKSDTLVNTADASLLPGRPQFKIELRHEKQGGGTRIHKIGPDGIVHEVEFDFGDGITGVRYLDEQRKLKSLKLSLPDGNVAERTFIDGVVKTEVHESDGTPHFTLERSEAGPESIEKRVAYYPNGNVRYTFESRGPSVTKQTHYFEDGMTVKMTTVVDQSGGVLDVFAANGTLQFRQLLAGKAAMPNDPTPYIVVQFFKPDNKTVTHQQRWRIEGRGVTMYQSDELIAQDGYHWVVELGAFDVPDLAEKAFNRAELRDEQGKVKRRVFVRADGTVICDDELTDGGTIEQRLTYSAADGVRNERVNLIVTRPDSTEAKLLRKEAEGAVGDIVYETHFQKLEKN